MLCVICFCVKAYQIRMQILNDDDDDVIPVSFNRMAFPINFEIGNWIRPGMRTIRFWQSSVNNSFPCPAGFVIKYLYMRRPIRSRMFYIYTHSHTIHHFHCLTNNT